VKIISRKDAKSKGLKRYYTGKPCKRGHVSEHFVRGSCVECELLRDRKRNRVDNMTPEQIESRRKRDRIANMTPEQIKRQNQRNRTRNSGFTPELFDYAYREQKGCCFLCGIELARDKVYADHDHDTKTPRALLCALCNSFEGWLKKIGVDPEEWGRNTNAYRRQPPAAGFASRPVNN